MILEKLIEGDLDIAPEMLHTYMVVRTRSFKLVM